MKMRGFIVAAMLVAVIVVFGTPASAERGDKDVRFGFIYSMPTSDYTAEGETTEMDGSLGFQASFEYGLTALMGVEAGFSSTSHDVTSTDLPDSDLGKMDLLTLAVGLNFHLVRSESMDLFVGPMLGNAFWGDLQFTDPAFDDYPTDDQVFFGVNAGIDLPIGEGGWAFSGSLRYSLLDAALEGGPDMGVDPLVLGAGLSYSF